MDMLKPISSIAQTLTDAATAAMEELVLPSSGDVNPTDGENAGHIDIEQVPVEPTKPSITRAANAVIMAEAGAAGGVSVMAQEISDIKISQQFDRDTGSTNQCKFFELKEFEYTTGHSDYQLLDTITLPRDYYASRDNPAHGNSRYFACVRTRFILQFQVNAPLGASGGILFIYQPRWANGDPQPGSLWNYPHVVLDIARTTTATLHVPYSAIYNYVKTDSDEQGYVIAYALNGLGVGAGTDNALYVAVYISAIDNELQNPRPAQQIRYLQVQNTPGSVNMGNFMHTVDAPTLAVANEQAIFDDQTPGMGERITDMMWLAHRPSMLENGSLDWVDLHQKNYLLFKEDVYITNAPNLKLLADSFMYFRGSLKISILVLSSGVHRGRLRICFFPNYEEGKDFTSEQSRNAIYSILDIASTNFGTLTVPYAAQTWIRKTTDKLGRLQIFVNNQLTKNVTAHNSVRAYVFLSLGEDAGFYSPRDSGVVYQGPTVPAPGALQTLEAPPETCDASNSRLINPGIYKESHTNVDHLFGRAWYVTQYTPHTGITSIPIPYPASGHAVLARSMAYFSGEVVITLMNATNQVLEASHSWDEDLNTEAKITSHGSIAVPPYGVASFVSPFYSLYVVRSVTWQHSLGKLIIAAHGDTPKGQVEVRVALKKPRFYMPIALPKTATQLNPTNWRHLLLPASAFTNEMGLTPTAPVHDLFADRMAAYTRMKISQQSEWVKDLTEDGDVESNPGPIYAVATSTKMNPSHIQVYDVSFAISVQSETGCFGKKITVRIFGSQPPNGSNVVVAALWDYEVASIVQANFCPGVKYIISPEASCLLDQVYPMFAHLGYSGGSILYALYRWFSTSASRQREGRPQYMLPRQVDYGAMGVKGAIQLPYQQDTPNFQQGPLDIFKALLLNFDNNVMGLTISAYAPIFMRSIAYLFCMYKTEDPAVTLVLGALMACDIAVAKPPSSIVILTEALMASGIDSLSRIFSVCFISGRIPRAIMTKLKSLLARRVSQQNGFLNLTRIVQSILFWARGIFKVFKMVTDYLAHDDTHAKNAEVLAKLYTKADEVYTRYSLPLADAPNREAERKMVIEKLLYVQPYVSQFGPDFEKRHSRAIDRLTRLKPVVDQLPPIRTEPLGVWISGPPGVGKSLLMTKLAIDLAEGKGVYYHPMGDKYFTLYNGQRVHCFDDLGQSKTEEDLAVLCQCISSAPFVVSGAAVEDKGTPYESEYVIATTNRNGFSTYTLTTPGAMERRFPLRITLPKPITHEKLSSGKFNVKLNGDEIAYSRLVEIIKEMAEMRRQKTRLTFQQGPSDLDPFVDDDDECEPGVIDLETTMSKPKLVNSSLFADEQDSTLDVTPKKEFKEYFSQAIQTVKSALDPVFIKDVMAVFGGIAAISTTLSVMWGFVAKIIDVIKSVYSTTSSQGPYNPTPHARRISPADYAAHRTEIQQQGPSLSGLRHLMKFCGHIKLKNQFLFVCAVDRNRVLMNTHIYKMLSSTSEYEFHFPGQSFISKIELDTELDDLAIVRVQNAIPLPSIWRYVKDPQNVGSGAILYYDPEGLLIQDISKIVQVDDVIARSGTGVMCNHGQSYQYTTMTADGMCGGLVIAKTSGNWAVLGIHAAGSYNCGYANAIFRVQPPSQQGVIIEAVEVSPTFVVSKTEYVKSPAANVIESRMEPAPLHGHDKRLSVKCDSLVDRVFQKYDSDVNPSDPGLLNYVTCDLTAEYTDEIGLRGATTIHEAITNMDSPMDRTASVGSKFKPNTRAQLVNFETGEIIDKFLATEVNRRLSGDWADCHFDTFLKDELRPREKVVQGKTRCVEACQLDVVIANRVLMLNLYVGFYNSDPAITGIAPGMNVYEEFGPMVRKLRQYNYCLDFSQYDSKLPESVIRAGVEVLANLHREPDRVRAAFEPFVVSRHRVGSTMYTVRGGMPSGCPATSILNSICNIIMARYIFAKLQLPTPLVIAYGDDNIISVDDRIPIEEVIKLYRAEFGMIATAADKTDNIAAVPPRAVEFLKRRLIWNDDLAMYVPALPLDNMLDRIAWKRKSSPFADQVRSFYLELAMYGHDVYTEIAEKLFPYVVLPNYTVALGLLRPILGIY